LAASGAVHAGKCKTAAACFPCIALFLRKTYNNYVSLETRVLLYEVIILFHIFRLSEPVEITALKCPYSPLETGSYIKTVHRFAPAPKAGLADASLF
jgi:hypothetical protein